MAVWLPRKQTNTMDVRKTMAGERRQQTQISNFQDFKMTFLTIFFTAKKSRSQDPAKLSNKEECGTQTDTHFVESYIDKSYEWNEWILRRKALQLVNVIN